MKVVLLCIFSLLSFATSPARAEYAPRQFVDIEKAVGGQIPFPPDRFIQSLESLDANSTVSGAVFPHGRSLKRFSTDIENPRTVMVWQSGLESTPYYLYFAYTPGDDELEIIAWSWPLRQFEFKVVHDYAPGKTPRVTSPPRGLCVACHQNGGPLFPEFPWSETILQPASSAEFRAQAKDALSKFILSPPNEARVRFNIQNAMVDLLVRNGNMFQQKQNVCLNACGGDLQCREGLLLSALNQSANFGAATIPSDSWVKIMNRAMRRVWPKDNFTIVSDSISDRLVHASDPLAISENQDPLRPRQSVDQLDADEGTTPNLMVAYARCWSFSPEQIRKLNSWGHAKVESAMHTEQMLSLVKTWLPSEEAIFSALGAALKSPQKIQSPSQIDWVPPVQKPEVISDPKRPKQSTAELYEKYCARCHAEPTLLAQELPLSDLKGLRDYVGTAKRTVRGLIDPTTPLMPPIGAPQPTLEERQQMILDLESK